MAVLIKGMEMPTSCESCPCKTADAFGGLGCQATGYIPLRKVNQSRPEWCPLLEVPSAQSTMGQQPDNDQSTETNVFDIEEIHENCTVQILTNSVTGETSIGWWENKKPGIRCPYCGGLLSEVRANGMRHCYSCHFEFKV